MCVCVCARARARTGVHACVYIAGSLTSVHHVCVCTLQGAVHVYIIMYVYIAGSCTSVHYMCVYCRELYKCTLYVYIAGSCTSVHYMCVYCRELYKCTLYVCTLQGAVQVYIMCVYIARSCASEHYVCVHSRELCTLKYGSAPEIRLNGHLDCSFPYIPQPLDYILHEMFKNAMRCVTTSTVYTQ